MNEMKKIMLKKILNYFRQKGQYTSRSRAYKPVPIKQTNDVKK